MSSDVLLGVWLLGLAGFVDAIAFMVLQGNFVAFMSGNTTVMGYAVATGRWSLVGVSAALLILFFIGCVAGASIVRWGGSRGHRGAMILLAALTIVAAIVANTASAHFGVMLIAVVGGLTSSVLAADTDVKVGLTYVTGTLVKAAHQLVAGIGTPHPWSWLSTAGFWFVLAVGAALGGIAFHGLGTTSLWIAAAMAVVACVLPHRRAPKGQ
ncbi:YoaK family protein [Microbacterium sp. A196]|uniref:YoaK family protein n=1 Tax=unclassified Microbacterium TaxID=2609290 RepID=UPI003FCFCD27